MAKQSSEEIDCEDLNVDLKSLDDIEEELECDLIVDFFNTWWVLASKNSSHVQVWVGKEEKKLGKVQQNITCYILRVRGFVQKFPKYIFLEGRG